MRIGFFADGFGHITFIVNQALAIAKHHDARFFTPEAVNYHHLAIDIDIIPYANSGLEHWVKSRLEWRDIYLSFHRRRFSEHLTARIEDFHPDILHCQFGWEALKLFHNYDVPETLPTIIQFRGYDASTMLHRRTYRKALASVLARPNVYPVFVCKHLRSNLNTAGIGFRNDSHILHSITDVDFFRRQERKQRDKDSVCKLVQISSFREKKGHAYLLRALHKLNRDEPEFCWSLTLTGGKSDERNNVERLVDEMGLRNQVNFAGACSPEKVKELLENSHVKILHSVTPESGDQEGIPNALMEAMSMELPVVSTFHAGIPELVEDGVHGRLVAEKDITALASAILDCSNWGYLKTGREKVVKSFSREQHVKTLLDIYTEVRGLVSEQPGNNQTESPRRSPR